jgi:hypothetical protein
MPGRNRRRDRFWFSFRRCGGQGQALSIRIKRAADIGRDLDLALHAAARDQGRIEFGKDIRQRQGDEHAITIVLSRKHVGSCLAQFTERDFDCSAG